MTKEGLELIKKFEGCRLKAYKCPAGVWTIGYGTTVYPDGTKVKKGDTITQDEAEELLMVHLDRLTAQLDEVMEGHPPLSLWQRDALVSFAYNCGMSALKRSTLLRKVKAAPDDPAIEEQFLRWVNVNGSPNYGLLRRRKAEVRLYFRVNDENFSKCDMK